MHRGGQRRAHSRRCTLHTPGTGTRPTQPLKAPAVATCMSLGLTATRIRAVWARVARFSALPRGSSTRAPACAPLAPPRIMGGWPSVPTHNHPAVHASMRISSNARGMVAATPALRARLTVYCAISHLLLAGAGNIGEPAARPSCILWLHSARRLHTTFMLCICWRTDKVGSTAVCHKARGHASDPGRASESPRPQNPPGVRGEWKLV